MTISLTIKAFQLRTGVFRPEFTIVEWQADKAHITTYTVDFSAATEEEAQRVATTQGIHYAKEKYGDDVHIIINPDGSPFT